ncbi:MAG: peptidyl-prolyl cis-trans isomerase [Planctomycetaceae bacterium]|nr:peptidyl-prolyl cis-trans isomerase [Planctomycetaceae bacterium]
MPFEVFRRHQRKLLAIFAIMAMFGFVVSDSLPRLLNSNPGGRDQKVAELYGKSVYQSQLNEMARQRTRANLFVSGLSQFPSREVFGGLKQRDLVDAMILQHEADQLNIPATAEIGREWLRQITGGRMNGELFNILFSRFSNEVSEEHLLADIANQVRLRKVRLLLGYPVVTPYDVYRSYRDQNERVGAKIVEMPVDSFLSKVSEPAASEVQALYDKYKDVLPDPASETPGFKIPRRVQLEILSLDGNALARGLRDKVTEAELRSYYENHKPEFQVPSELPTDLFAGQPDLTPPIIQAFSEVRDTLAPRLAEEKAQSEILDKFTRIKEAEMIPFADKYLAALDEQEEAKKQGNASSVVLPTPQDLKPIADREGLNYEKTPLLSRQDVERLGQISTAEVGLTPLSGGRKFVDEMFDPKTGLYEPIELTDVLGTRFLVRKVKDEPPHVPTLEQVRSEVIVAWKMAQARPLAEKAAGELASQIKAKGATPKDSKIDGFRVESIPPITRSQTSFMPSSMFEPSPVVETPIPGVPQAGEAFRDAYFGLQAGSVDVAPNQPRTVYYIMTLDRREPASFSALYASNGDEYRYKSMAREQASRQQDEQWMGWLRQQAGLKPDWIPPDEAKKDEAARG